jgi:uncharacterized oligopeptide transporter (OPT) family protein
MNKKKVPVLSIVLYVLTGLIVIYAIWAIIHSVGYISDMISQGQLTVKGNEFEIVSYYMNNCAQYVVFAAILFSLGWILQKALACKKVSAENTNDTISPLQAENPEENGADLENFIQNNENDKTENEK